MRISKELRQRTKRFGSQIIQLYIRLPKRRDEVLILGKQMLRAGTSVPAHTREASRARSDAELCSKLDGLLQEADETQLWLEYLIEDFRLNDNKIPILIKECDELISIFATIVNKVRKSQ
jgi:four helix bundle protein